MKMVKLKTFFLYGFTATLLVGTHSLNQNFRKPPLFVSNQDLKLNLDSEMLDLFNLGNRRLYSSLLWVHTVVEGDSEHYKKRDLNSWIFHRLNTITDLTPKFRIAYIMGGEYLNVVKDDIVGARKILQKGLTHFPDDFWLNFNAGTLEYREFQNSQKAIEHFDRIKFHPKTEEKAPYLANLIVKLRGRLGLSREDQINILKTYLKKAPSGSQIEKALIEKIQKLNY